MGLRLGWGGRKEGAGRTGSGDEAEVVRHRRVVDDSVCDHDEGGLRWTVGMCSVRFWESIVVV